MRTFSSTRKSKKTNFLQISNATNKMASSDDIYRNFDIWASCFAPFKPGSWQPGKGRDFTLMNVKRKRGNIILDRQKRLIHDCWCFLPQGWMVNCKRLNKKLSKKSVFRRGQQTETWYVHDLRKRFMQTQKSIKQASTFWAQKKMRKCSERFPDSNQRKHRS